MRNEPDDLRFSKDHSGRPWAARADAVFVSRLQRRDEPSAGQVRQVVAEAIGAFGCPGCAGRVAQEFGDHPETAVIRMRWARGVAREAFADPAPEPDPVPGMEWHFRGLLCRERLAQAAVSER